MADINPVSAENFPIDTVMTILGETVRDWPPPFVTQCALDRASPFKILVATILSLRTHDRPTQQATEALFALAHTQDEMMRLPLAQVAGAITPVMYPGQKAQTIIDLSRRLVEEYGGQVPDDIDELNRFKGIGRKTANLVVTLAFHKPAICVDIHVHRITNRWGYVETKTPDDTELALRRKLPEQWWPVINDWLIRFGQHLCLPIAPLCSKCPLFAYCQRRGVTKSR